MNNTHRPIDCKREEYRKYLERTGVLEALTKTLASLFEEPEKPTDALSYLYKFFNESFPDKNNLTKDLENELAETKAKVEQLTKELAATQAELAALKSAEEKDEEAMLEDTPDIPINETVPTITVEKEANIVLPTVANPPAPQTTAEAPVEAVVVSDATVLPDVLTNTA